MRPSLRALLACAAVIVLPSGVMGQQDPASTLRSQEPEERAPAPAVVTEDEPAAATELSPTESAAQRDDDDGAAPAPFAPESTTTHRSADSGERTDGTASSALGQPGGTTLDDASPVATALPAPAFSVASEEATVEDGLPSPVVALPPPLDEGAGASASERVNAFTDPRRIGTERMAGWLEASVLAGGRDGESIVAFVPELGLRFRIASWLVADASWGLAVASTAVAGEETLSSVDVTYDDDVVRTEPGNPVISISYADEVLAGLHLEAGLGLGVPAAAHAQLGVDAEGLAVRAASELTYRAALSMRGFWSPWRFAPERISFFAPFAVAGRIGDVFLEAEGAAAVLVGVLGASASPLDVVMQLGAGVGVAVLEQLRLGVRVRAVGAARGSTVPGVVASAEPYLRLRLSPISLWVRGVLNLNGGYGLVGRRGLGHGIFAGVGGGF